MSNSNLFIAGSIHQGSERLSDISRGRQCSFMSFSALLFAQTLPIEQWTTCNVDHILAQGDRFYVDAFESRSIPDTETLSLDRDVTRTLIGGVYIHIFMFCPTSFFSN